MSYDADYDGEFYFAPNTDILDTKELLSEFFEVNQTSPSYVSIVGYTNYDEDEVYDVLNQISGNLVQGSIEFEGEDNNAWKIIYNYAKKQWEEYEGIRVYPKDRLLKVVSVTDNSSLGDS